MTLRYGPKQVGLPYVVQEELVCFPGQDAHYGMVESQAPTGYTTLIPGCTAIHTTRLKVK